MSDFSPAQLALDPILAHFGYEHLPRPVREVAGAYTTLAVLIVSALPRGAERTVSLRKLLEARDAGIRSAAEMDRPFRAARHVNAEDFAAVHDAGNRDEIIGARTIGKGSPEDPIPFKT